MTLVEDLDAPNIPFKKGDLERKRKILELFSGGQLGASAIARIVGGTESSVRQVRDTVGMLTRRRKLLKQDRVNRWYESITDENLEELIAAARKEIQNGILKSLTQ